MHILAQKYLDGELNDLERQAFLEDLAHDPRVAEVLEQEAQLDRAVVEDSYSIEPPAHLRSAVLDAVSKHSAPRNMFGLRAVSRIIATGLMMVSVEVNRPRTFEDVSYTSTDMPGLSAAASHMSTETSHTSTETSNTSTETPRTSAAAPYVSVSSVSGTDNSVIDSPTPFTPSTIAKQASHAPVESSPMQSMLALTPASVSLSAPASEYAEANTSAKRATILAAWSPWIDGPMTSMPMTGMRNQQGTLLGLLSASGASMRYQLEVSDELFFVESGFVVARTQSTMFMNGAERRIEQQQNLPFALVGMQGSLGVLPLLNRNVSASVALGMAAIGPLVVADASVPVLYLGTTSVDAGLRMVGAADLRQKNSLLVIPQPFVRVSLGL
ncbi:MAG: anti-sigma factor family protein [Candidatus Kapaibacterium sp.]